MAGRLEFAASAERDFRIILAYLTEAYAALGDDPASAAARAAARARSIRRAAERIAAAPGMGERRDDVAAGLRHVALGRAIYWFDQRPDGGVTILAIFLAGEDHRRKMARRLARPGGEGGGR